MFDNQISQTSNLNQITYEQAISNLDIAIGQIKASRQEHIILQLSLMKLNELVQITRKIENTKKIEP